MLNNKRESCWALKVNLIIWLNDNLKMCCKACCKACFKEKACQNLQRVFLLTLIGNFTNKNAKSSCFHENTHIQLLFLHFHLYFLNWCDISLSLSIFTCRCSFCAAYSYFGTHIRCNCTYCVVICCKYGHLRCNML